MINWKLASAVLALWLLSTGKTYSQCPIALNCNIGTDTLCDLTSNDSLLWNNALWWDPLPGEPDLSETPAQLQFRVLDTCGGATIRCLLFLDLDGNGSFESVLNSDSMPPSGRFFFNNAANPGYAADTSLAMDARPVPGADKYRFALQQTALGDTLQTELKWTTEAHPDQFTTPEIPGRRFRVVWLVENAGWADTCSSITVVRDCVAPVIVCKNDLVSNLGPSGLAVVWAVDLVQNASDDNTPVNQLQISVRRAGDGSGFPVNTNGEPVASVFIDCCDLGPQPVELWVRDLAGNTTSCTTFVDIQDVFGNCNGICGESLFACTKTVSDSTDLDQVQVGYQENIVELFANSMQEACVEFGSVIDGGDSYRVWAGKDDNPLNGVSTFDLVLITKHILNLEPLNAPWKILAADANRSNSVTTFDVVELRKLILGIYNHFPNNTSWRFLPENVVFPDPANPFATPFSDTLVVNNYPGTGPARDTLYGYKVGDVNGSATVNLNDSDPDERSSAALLLPDWTFERGETKDIVVRPEAGGNWLGMQFVLTFNPEYLEIQQVAPGVLAGLDEQAWAQPRPGVLHFSWFNALPQTVLPDEDLLRLRVRAVQAGRLQNVAALASDRMRPEVYSEGGLVRRLELGFADRTDVPVVGDALSPMPNPTHAGVYFPLRLGEIETSMLELLDASGRAVYYSEKTLGAGNQLLEVPAATFPAAGLYVWRLKIGSEVRTGKIVRL